MLAQTLSTPPTIKPNIHEVSERDMLFAELEALPDAPSRRRRKRVAKKLEARQDFATYNAYRRALEIHEKLEDLPE